MTGPLRTKFRLDSKPKRPEGTESEKCWKIKKKENEDYFSPVNYQATNYNLRGIRLLSYMDAFGKVLCSFNDAPFSKNDEL